VIQNNKDARTMRKPQSIQYSLAGLFGAMWGVLVIGRAPLNPTNVDWLRIGDLSSAYTNLMYFRRSDWLQWPITALPEYGIGWSTMFNEVGVVPLGFLVKLLDPLLPQHFQYFGLWFLACFILQGIIAYALLARLSLSTASVWVGVFLLITAPVLTFRVLNLGHHDLAAHWLILLSLLLYRRQNIRPVQLGMFLLLVLSVNAYLFVITTVVVTAHIISLVIVGAQRMQPTQLVKALSFAYLPSVVGYAAFGYLSWGSSVVGVGTFKLNALAPFAPNYGGESFAFLGFGVVAACVLSVFMFPRVSRQWFRRVAPLVAAAILLYLVALSNEIAVGNWTFTYPIPDFIETLRQVVRVSNRLAWLLYYLLIVGAIVGIDRALLKTRVVGYGVILMVVIAQLFSVWPTVASRDVGVLRRAPRVSVIQDSRWEAWSSSVQRVTIYPVFDVQAERDSETSRGLVLAQTLDWYDIIWWAAEHNLPINFAYRSRPVGDIVSRENARLQTEFTSGTLNDQTLYITATRDEWRLVVPQIPMSMDTRFIDGLYVIYPVNEGSQ
jgi:hypothetical protein